MRINEVILEYKKYPTEDYEGLKMSMVEKDGQLIVKAIDDWGVHELGYVIFNIGDNDELDPQDLRVEDKYQGQGIAKIMYDFVQSHGYEIHRSYDQTDAGAGFWNKHRGEDVRVWEDYSDDDEEESNEPKTEVTEYRGVPMKITETDDEVEITALDKQGNKVLGHVRFGRFYDDLEAKYVEVDERYRGQGIATLMYDFATNRGYTIKRSWDQTDDGASFWDKNRGEETVWEDNDIDEGWKDWVAGAAMGAAALGAHGDAEAATKRHQVNKPAITQQVKMQKVTPEQSRNGESPADLKAYVEAMAQKYLPANQVAQFVGQVAHETANFTSMVEQNPEKNLKHYAKAKNPLGNAGMADAQKYIGRGFLQITGKYNYKHFGDKIRPGFGDELLKNPNLAMRKDVAIALAVYFWRERVAPKMDAGASNKEIATAINGRKPKGLEQRAQAVKVAAANIAPRRRG